MRWEDFLLRGTNVAIAGFWKELALSCNLIGERAEGDSRRQLAGLGCGQHQETKYDPLLFGEQS